jgi:DNA repair protein SbcC/Rad50
MIPLRVYVKGFLSYRDEAELTFDGSTLWMLGGPNGAGKSAVFDAITFALYGANRDGGKVNLEELINRESRELVVEFDFALGDDVYRAKRTLAAKRRPTQQILHLSGPGVLRPAKPGPLPIPDTDKKDGFADWVQHNIGLRYETFTASVLLRQGESDALLKAEPKDRHQMLAQIVGLAAYERLCQKADVRHKEQDRLAKLYQGQLAGLPPVEPSEIEAAAAQAESARLELEAARAQLEGLSAARVQADRWGRLQGEERGLEESLRAAKAALLAVGGEALAAAGAAIDGGAFVAVSEELIRGVDEQVGQAQNESQRLTEMSLALHPLQTFARARGEWREAQTQAADAQAALAQADANLTSARAAKAEAEKRYATLSAEARQRQEALSEAKAALKTQQSQMARFEQVDGAPSCGYCGQPLSPQHLAAERSRLELELAAARERAAAAAREQQDAAAREQQAAQEWQQQNAREQELERERQRLEQQLQTARRDGSRAEAEARESWAGLPARYRQRIAEREDFAADVCFASERPTAEDLENFSRQVTRLGGVRERLRQLQSLAALLREQQEREGRWRAVQRELQEIPAAARRPVAEIDAELRLLRERHGRLDAARAEAERRRHELEARRERRRELEASRRDAAHQAALHKELARRLGRDFLQRHLLRQAEASIVRHANQVLDHISGGTLRLGLKPDEPGAEAEGAAKAVKAFDLLVESSLTAGAPLSVASLSGGQKFRVAISLALGVGQYASGSARRLEAVIIDEGFASLDKQGRREMIDELHHLKDVLRRIILVSHLDEFADAFPNRYEVALADGTSRVTLLNQA